ncbi:MAG: B12-binding domain-containing protein [Treponema sp.]|jgi:methanogenic corrinoid protein MtbC1|nr:B12-binding domain-containing protein [Treponema sp.]
MVNLSDISKSLQSGKAGETSDLIAKAIQENYSVESILKQGLIPGMCAVICRYKRKEIFQPELLVAARAMNMGIRTLRLLIAASSAGKPKGTVIIGTVKGDIQDIEKNLMAVTMEGIGLRVIDLGTGVSPERFIEAAIAEKARIVLCIANLPAAMGQLKLVVHAATTSGIRNRIKIIISGVPVTEKYCRTIGADHYARDTVSAAEMAGLICSGEK